MDALMNKMDGWMGGRLHRIRPKQSSNALIH